MDVPSGGIRSRVVSFLRLGAHVGASRLFVGGGANHGLYHRLVSLGQRLVQVLRVFQRELAQALPATHLQTLRPGLNLLQVRGVHHAGVSEQVLEHRLGHARVLLDEVQRRVRDAEDGLVVRIHLGEKTDARLGGDDGAALGGGVARLEESGLDERALGLYLFGFGELARHEETTTEEANLLLRLGDHLLLALGLDLLAHASRLERRLERGHRVLDLVRGNLLGDASQRHL